MTTPSVPASQGAPTATPPPPQQPRRRGGRKFVTVIVLLACVAGGWMFFHRKPAEKATTGESGGPRTVAVAKAEREDLAEYTVLTAEFLPYQAVSVHAKVAGYVKSITVDIGDHVKSGQVIAELEIPELTDDLHKAEAEWMTSQEEVKREQANYEEVHLAFQRLMGVVKANPKLVAQQDVDTARAKDDAMASALNAAEKRVVQNEANVGKMKAMLGYASIVAPFDGVITRRYSDTGALVQAGTASETQSMPVVDIAEDDVLRLIFPVPESAVSAIHDGLPVDINVKSLGLSLPGKVTRYAGKVDFDTRTMRTEVDVPNSDGKLTPGMYATVKVPLKQRKDVVTVPLQALSSGDTPTVLLVNKQGEIEERKVKVGLQTSTLAEITSGLEPGDMVVTGSRNGLSAGEKVSGRVVELGETAAR